MMRLAKLWHVLKHGISCSDGEWDTRQHIMARLRENGYFVEEVPDPRRLNARKEKDVFIIDILGENKVHVLPVKWVDGYTDEPILLMDIPDTGRYGILDKESRYYDEIKQLVKPNRGWQ